MINYKIILQKKKKNLYRNYCKTRTNYLQYKKFFDINKKE